MVLEEVSTCTQQLWTFVGMDENRQYEKGLLKANEVVTTIAGLTLISSWELFCRAVVTEH